MNRRAMPATRPPSWLLVAAWPLLLLLVDRGRLNADTKYDLTGDPWRLMRVALSSWDETLHGGWVSQQHAGYLWPSGPFFALTDFAPDWVQQRLWVICLLIVAGLGARFAARQLECAAGAATVAGLVYQVSPYAVPYLSRTSAMLLPWAVAGWVLGSAVLATRRPSPRWIAVIAFAFATAGGVNSTAILMITPLPVLWFWWARRTGEITTSRAIGLGVSTAVSTALAGAWWLASAWIGSRHGPDLLSFSETINDVSRTATSPEVLRLSGYWLTYVVEGNGLATTDVGRLLTSSVPVVAATMAVALAGLVGSLAGRWRHRGFAAAVTVVSVLLAIGVHPVDNPSPLGGLALDGLSDTVITALRSSSRALPMLGLILSIGAARFVSRLRPQPALVFAGLGLLAVAAPWFSTGRIVDPALERTSAPPATWGEPLHAVADSHRLLVVPGSEFSTFSWGHTQDPPWTSTTSVITRELLPLGAPDRMDLLLALDDAIQEGRWRPESVAIVAQLLGADMVWVASDIEQERYRTAPLSADALDAVVGFDRVAVVDGVAGVFEVNSADVGTSGGEVAIAGAGRGTLAAIDAGLLGPGTVAWRIGSAPEGVPVIVTDGDRDAVRQWRTSQGTVGAVGELSDRTRDGIAELISPDPIRTNVRFGADDSTTVSASTYGDPFEFHPEYRAAMALDGDIGTAWIVADPGSRPSISIEGYVDRLAPVTVADNGSILALVVESTSRAGTESVLLVPGADGTFDPIDLPDETYSVTVTIETVSPGTTGAGLAELLDGPLVESLVIPPVATGNAVVLDRWRLPRVISGRSDPEPVLRRVIPMTGDGDFSLRVIGVGDGGTECRTGVIDIDGVDIPIDTATGGTCDGIPVQLTAGEHQVTSSADTVVMTPIGWSVRAPECCTIVLPHAYSDGWSVTLDGIDLEPVSLAGGAMGIRVPDGVVLDDLDVVWEPDRWYRVALAISGIAAVAIALVVIVDPGASPRRRSRIRPSTGSIERRLLRALITGVIVAATVVPIAGAVAAALVLLVPRVEWLGLSVVAGGMAAVVAEVAMDSPQHGIAWPGHFEILHVPIATAIVMVGAWLATEPVDHLA